MTENGWVTTIIFSSIILFSVGSSDTLDFEPLELGCTVFTLHEKRTVHAHKSLCLYCKEFDYFTWEYPSQLSLLKLQQNIILMGKGGTLQKVS